MPSVVRANLLAAAFHAIRKAEESKRVPPTPVPAEEQDGHPGATPPASATPEGPDTYVTNPPRTQVRITAPPESLLGQFLDWLG